MDQSIPNSVRRPLVVGLLALVALLAAVGMTGLGSANAAETSGTSAPSFQPVQSATPEATSPGDERADGEDCPKRGASNGGGEQQDGSATPSPAPGTDASV